MTLIVADDTEQWAEARAGNGRAFGELFDRHRDHVHRHAARLSESTAAAEDIVAGAFLELWRRRDAVPVVEGSVLPWLLVTATNLARNRSRGLRRHRGAIERMSRSLPAADAARTAEDRLARAELVAAITSLGERDAALLVLTALEELSPAEAAAALGITPGAARVRLHRARARLRDRLAGTDPAHLTSERGTSR
jgi:RNA polymerase sigma-70 factor (ECF subfamily)